MCKTPGAMSPGQASFLPAAAGVRYITIEPTDLPKKLPLSADTVFRYVNHLNARNPFTGMPIVEPGRVFFVKVSYSF